MPEIIVIFLHDIVTIKKHEIETNSEKMKIIIAGGLNEGRYQPYAENLLARLINRANRFIDADMLVIEGPAPFDNLLKSARCQVKINPASKISDEIGPLCGEAMQYQIFDTEKKRRTIESLKLPPLTAFSDFHIHTPLAYCNENVNFKSVKVLAAAFGLAKIGYSEHSGHLYFPQTDYWGTNEWHTAGMKASDRFDRTKDYFDMVKPWHNDKCRLGMEIDVSETGEILAAAEVLSQLDYKIGAVHRVKEVTDGSSDAEICRSLLRQSEALLKSGIDILAHPLREIIWYNHPMPNGLPEAMARMIKDYGCVAELNFHHNTPNDRFVLACLEAGVKFSFGGDVHNLYELGEFYPQIQMLKRLSPEIKINEVLANL